MAKTRSFADKMKKDRGGAVCPVCGGAQQAVKTVTPEVSPSNGAWKFRTRMVVVCKCNHKEVYDS
ncbi:MAG TPA: hypothetical protein VM118_09655 [Acidobacteriota bacterium]|nr:hypothetical protein [Acidobacteriota bacterium]